MRLSRKRALQILFLILVVPLTVTLVGATINYVEFYSALKNFEVQVKSLSFSMEGDEVKIFINYTVTNPTPYENLEFSSLMSDVYYQGENHTVVISPGGPMTGMPFQEIQTDWWELTSQEKSLNWRFVPYSAIPLSVILTVTGTDAELFIDFFEKKGKYEENIQWMINSVAFISTPTFLENLDFEFQQFIQT